VFHDLDASLAALVRAELSLPDVDISFVGPDEGFPPSSVRLPAVSFFLYDIRENTDLRSNEWEVKRRPDGSATRTRAPARVTCSYLITAWPSDATPDPAQDEHRLLGAVLTVLLRHRKIPAAYLRGELVGQEPPVPTRIIAENQLQSLGEFWQAMGGRPKASLHYGVTLSLDIFEPSDAGTPVSDRLITITQGVDAG
jgi:Pvc16 N-terminal domain